MSETSILHDVLLALGRHPKCKVWRCNTGALADHMGRVVRFGVPGCADVIGMLVPSGRFLAVEVKTATGKQSDQQRKFQLMTERAGGVYVLVRSAAEAVAAVEAA